MSTLREQARLGLPLHNEVVIDAHAHYGYFHQSPVPMSSYAEMLQNMDRLGIDKTCICAGECGSMGSNEISNTNLLECVLSAPDRFLGYVTLNGNEKAGILEFLLRYEAAGLKLGVKMHTYRQFFRITDDFLQPVFEHLNQRRALALHHDFGTPDELEAVLRLYPDITFITGHPSEQHFPLATRYENMYICTCASLRCDDIAAMVSKLGADNIVYGSDTGVLDSTFGFGPVLFSSITDAEKRQLLGLNMQRILNRIR